MLFKIIIGSPWHEISDIIIYIYIYIFISNIWINIKYIKTYIINYHPNKVNIELLTKKVGRWKRTPGCNLCNSALVPHWFRNKLYPTLGCFGGPAVYDHFIYRVLQLSYNDSTSSLNRNKPKENVNSYIEWWTSIMGKFKLVRTVLAALGEKGAGWKCNRTCLQSPTNRMVTHLLTTKNYLAG